MKFNWNWWESISPTQTETSTLAPTISNTTETTDYETPIERGQSAAAEYQAINQNALRLNSLRKDTETDYMKYVIMAGITLLVLGGGYLLIEGEEKD